MRIILSSTQMFVIDSGSETSWPSGTFPSLLSETFGDLQMMTDH